MPEWWEDDCGDIPMMGQAAAAPPTPERPVLKARFEDSPPAADSAPADSAAEAAPAAATDAPAPAPDEDGEKENQASPSPPSSSPPPAIVAAPVAVAVAAKSRPPFQRPLDLRANGSREPARPYVRAPPPPPRRGASASASASSSDLPHNTDATTNDDYYDDDDVGDIPMVGGTRADDDLPPPPPSPTAAGGPARPAPGASGARLGDVDEATGIPLGPIPASPDQVQLARTRADGRARPTGGGGGGGGGVLRVGRGLFGKGRRGSGEGGNSLDESGAEYVAAPLPSSRNLPPRPPSPADEADREAVPEEAGATPAWAPAVDATDDGVVNDSLRAEVEEEARMRATILDVNGDDDDDLGAGGAVAPSAAAAAAAAAAEISAISEAAPGDEDRDPTFTAGPMAGFGTSSSDGSLPEEVRVQVDDALRRVEEKVAAAVAAAEAEAEREGPEDEDEDEDEDEEDGPEAGAGPEPAEDSMRLSDIADEISPIKAAGPGEEEGGEPGEVVHEVDVGAHERGEARARGQASALAFVSGLDEQEQEQERAREAAVATPSPSKKGRKKPTWRAVLDAESGDFYYYNRRTRETTWDRPEGAEVDDRAIRGAQGEVSGSGSAAASGSAPASGEALEASEVTDDSFVKSFIRQAGGGEEEEEQEEEEQGERMTEQDEELEQQPEGEAKEEGAEEEEAKEEAVPKPVGKWKAVVDKASGDTYYYNTVTKETTWDRPAEYVEKKRGRRGLSGLMAKVEAKGGAAKKPLKLLKKVGGKVTRKSPRSSEEVSDLTGGSDELNVDVVLEDVGGGDVSAEAYGSPTEEAEPSPTNILDGPVPEGEQAAQGEKRKGKKPLWKAIVDQSTQETYYYNRKTRETSWDKPEGFVEAV